MSVSSRKDMLRPGRRVWITLGAVAVAAAALVDVRVTGPRIAVRWAASVSDSSRAQLERRYSLEDGRRDGGPEWRYQLGDRSRENIGALVRDPAVADTGYIDRAQLTAGEPEVELGVRPLPFPLSTDDEFRDLGQLFQIQSLCLLLAGGGLLWTARRDAPRLRRRLAVATIVAVAATAYALPLPPTLHMGDADTYTSDRASFESYAGVRAVRFEAHLSHAILGRLDAVLGRTDASPNQALNLLMRLATAWFAVSALGIGFLERWSPHVVRYLGLTLLAPAALLYFGYRELGHLSLNLAAYPLLIRGLASGPPRLEASSVLSGVGAALHGFGLLSLLGSCLAAPAIKARWTERARALLRVIAWGTAAYVGWIAIYVMVLSLPVTQGHTEVIPWRPWLADQPAGDRVNVAILSATGARDLLFTAWVVGAPLVGVAASLWRTHRDELRLALAYAVPSIVFSIAFWPIQGLGVEMDLVVAAFPAFYALAWVCAHDAGRTVMAALVLVSGHIAFWRIVLDGRFMN
jgi:hypothetical protein